MWAGFDTGRLMNVLPSGDAARHFWPLLITSVGSSQEASFIGVDASGDDLDQKCLVADSILP